VKFASSVNNEAIKAREAASMPSSPSTAQPDTAAVSIAGQSAGNEQESGAGSSRPSTSIVASSIFPNFSLKLLKGQSASNLFIFD
jgi:hypothetical protein